LIIRCEKCSATYHLDQKLIEPFGSKVRCTRCGHIFRAEPPSFSEVQALPKLDQKAKPILTFDEEEEMAALPIQPTKKKTLWGLIIIILLVLMAVTGRFFYIQYLHPNWSISDVWSSVFFLPADMEGNQKISLVNIKKYFKENPKIGRFFIIEGEIKNIYPDVRQGIKIRGSLRTAENRVAVSREVYAGWTLTPEELENLSFEEMNQLASTQSERFSTTIRVLPGKTLPFMILFPPLPPGSTQVSIEVVSSHKAQPATLPKSPMN